MFRRVHVQHDGEHVRHRRNVVLAVGEATVIFLDFLDQVGPGRDPVAAIVGRPEDLRHGLLQTPPSFLGIFVALDEVEDVNVAAEFRGNVRWLFDRNGSGCLHDRYLSFAMLIHLNHQVMTCKAQS